MKCPYCGQEMVLGYVQCRDGLFWTPKKQPVAALSCFGRGRICLANSASNSVNTACAFHCETCRKIVIDYGVEYP